MHHNFSKNEIIVGRRRRKRGNRKNVAQIEPYVTKDGSLIFEIFHPNNSEISNMSIAEARLLPGSETVPHVHLESEEVYVILSGTGLMKLDEEEFFVSEGDIVFIPEKTVHCIKNTSDKILRFLCICSPPYSHSDTVLGK